MRTVYTVLAASLLSLAFTGLLSPVLVLAIAAVMGMVRPSDIGMRAALVGATMPGGQLMGAMSIQRTTQDSARIVGALTGAGLVAMLGMAPAYLVVTSLYAASVLLTLKADRARPARHPEPDAAPRPARPSPWRDLREGLSYVWNTPLLLAVMLLAFLLNATAFPLFNALLPYVAKEIYHADQTMLGYMVAGSSLGALLGSIALSRHSGAMRPARMMVVFAAAWYALILVFAWVEHPGMGILVLLLGGIAQSVGLIPMLAILLRHSEEQFRGRIMGIRMLAIYGNLPGLFIAGPLIARFGYPATATLYCIIGVVFTLLIAVCWREHLWRLGARANTR
jgi:predicted MFS family arabinose efflux permease